jgi:hypothetical protein
MPAILLVNIKESVFGGTKGSNNSLGSFEVPEEKQKGWSYWSSYEASGCRNGSSDVSPEFPSRW